MISVNHVSVHFGGFELFNDISFLINQKDRIGLVGKNGAGKSTLLKIIIGQENPTMGSVEMPNRLIKGYLPQQMSCSNDKTVYDETYSAFTEIISLTDKITHLTHLIENRTDYHSDEYLSIIEKLTDANERFELLGGNSLQADIEQTLTGLGFAVPDFSKATAELSGGWRMRIELAKILLQKPDILLLDEPTNHLDIESIQWLEDYLKTFPGAVILISHDRAFLDNVTTRTVEISLGKIYDYKVSYTKYVELRKERRQTQLNAFQNQQKKIEDTERFIERFRYKNTKAVQVQSRIKQLEKIDRIEVDEEDNSSMHFKFPPAPHSGNIVMESIELSKSYGSHKVLDKVDFILEKNEKVAFVGKNGEGKTTFSRIIVGELDHTGILKPGHKVEIGYYAQNQDLLLDEEKTVLQTIDEIAVGDIRTRIRDILGSFLFSGEDVDKKVKVLSGGERSRLALAKLLLRPVNLLVLDEPTNHLDMRSKDILKESLLKYDGTLLIVSHDRYFLDGLVTKVYEFRSKKIRQHIGGIYDFLQRKKIETLKELEQKRAVAVKTQDNAPSANKMDYLDKKELEKEIRKVTNRLGASEKRIEELEKEIEDLNLAISSPENTGNHDLYIRFEQVKKDMETELENWEKTGIELENLRQKRK
ncbi:MAG: glycosyl transferase family 2 [Bacteroidetes bacterium GWF2_38_335]|nr:MAG: glycosyl transferase family 2 [Bacteroidetes bacterium GWF2_38_335]OFY80695.1 MAG: glycosyl transferase family 2 [Bacteroidetes bacterium RIFOXYA12_FULL_38_20]HBS87043.1 glycosyl transferase family 2 [Bacteroidales bacterium]